METLHMSCLKDVSKLLFMCCPASKEKKMEVGNTDEILKACEAVSEIRVEVDKLSQRVTIYMLTFAFFSLEKLDVLLPFLAASRYHHCKHLFRVE